MSRAFSLLRGSKQRSGSVAEQERSTDDKPPSYTAADEVQEGKITLKTTDKKGLKVRTVSITKHDFAEKQSAQASCKTPDNELAFVAAAFGPKHYYFCAYTQTSPQAVGFACQSNPGSFIIIKQKDISTIFWYTKSPYGDELVAYRDKSSGLAMWTFQKCPDRPEDAPLYLSLLKWLRKNVPHNEDSLKQSSVVFGPHGSYFARSATACIWHDIPDRLCEKMDALFPGTEEGPDRPIPELVALGANSCAIVLWPTGTGEGKRVSSLTMGDSFWREWVDSERKDEEIEMLSMSLVDLDDYFVCTKAGAVDMRFGSADQGTHRLLLNVIVNWMQKKATQGEISFVVEITTDGVPNNVTISPKTKWTGVNFQKK